MPVSDTPAVSAYWSGAVAISGRVVVSSGDTSLGRCLSRLITDAVYYAAMYPFTAITITELRESCAKCHNEGTVEKGMAGRNRRVRCPVCKGKRLTGTCDDIVFAMPDAANKISLVVADGAINAAKQP